jgi:hypothetical protein
MIEKKKHCDNICQIVSNIALGSPPQVHALVVYAHGALIYELLCIMSTDSDGYDTCKAAAWAIAHIMEYGNDATLTLFISHVTAEQSFDTFVAVVALH